MQQAFNHLGQKGQQYDGTPPLLSERTKQPSQHVWRLALAAVLGLIIGFIIGALVFRDASVSEPSEPTGDVEGVGMTEGAAEGATDESGRVTLSPASTSAEDMVLVKDQGAGNSVFLSRVELGAPSWVAIQDDDTETPGTILGAQRFDAGVYQGTVSLLRPTQAGRTYRAVVWRDNGDKVFDLESDVPVAGATMLFEIYAAGE